MATRRVYDPSGKGFYEEEISQYKADGLLDGCYVMQGRRCMIDVAAADERLRRNIDPGQPARKPGFISTEQWDTCKNLFKQFERSMVETDHSLFPYPTELLVACGVINQENIQNVKIQA